MLGSCVEMGFGNGAFLPLSGGTLTDDVTFATTKGLKSAASNTGTIIFSLYENGAYVTGLTGQNSATAATWQFARPVLLGGSLSYGAFAERLEINNTAEGNYSSEAINEWSTTAAARAGILNFNRSRNATIGTQTVVASGDYLGYVIFSGSDGTNWQIGADIICVASGTMGDNRVPAYFGFHCWSDIAASAEIEVLKLAADAVTFVTTNAAQTAGLTRLAIGGASDAASVTITSGAGAGIALRLTDVATNATNKQGILAGKNYLAAEEDTCILAHYAVSGTATLYIGGAVGNLNATTTISFYTATDDVTLAGTLRASITTTGINLASGHVLSVNAVQVVGARVIDARCDDSLNTGDATSDGVIDALRDAMIAHGLVAAA